MIPAWHSSTLIWTGVFLHSSIQCWSLFLVKTMNVVHLTIKPCVWSWPRCDSEWFKKQKNKSRAWVFDLALWGAHHISISLLADVDGGVSDCGRPLCSGPVLQALGKEEGGLLTPYSPPQTQTTSCPMSDAPLSLSWPQRQTPGQLDTAWNPTQSPHSHHQWPPPSCPWPITQSITINFCPAAKQHTQQSSQSDSALLVHVKIALSEGRKWSWWRGVSALGYDGILHAT